MAQTQLARFNQLIKALESEKDEEINRYHIKAKNLKLIEKIKLGICLHPLSYNSIEYADSGQTIFLFGTPSNQSTQHFKTGQSIVLFNGDELSVKGIIRTLKEDTIQIICNDDSIHDWIKKGKIGLQILPDTRTIDYYIEALKVNLDSPNALISALYNFDDTLYTDLSQPDFSSPLLNDSQNQAVQHILGQNKISIIHGPPGTGKTTTLIEAFKAIVIKNKKAFITAPTHAAVDHICKQLIKANVNFLRIGNDLKVADEVEPFLLDQKIKNDPDYHRVKALKKEESVLRKKAFQFKRNFGSSEYQTRKQDKLALKAIRQDIRRLRRDIGQFHIEKSNLIIGTFIGLKQVEKDIDSADYLFVDEAGQAIEPAVWLLSNHVEKLVLAGDHLQLPPTVFAKEAIRLNLDQSAIEFANTINHPTLFLDIQYRMYEDIVEFSNQYFYEGLIKTATKILAQKRVSKSIDFIDTAGCDFEESKDLNFGTISNQGERKVIGLLLNELKPNTSSIAIISPYRYQVECLKNEFPDFNNCINTIDAFQGQERPIIIISLVRSNSASEIGFLSDYRRLNVAMTRAQQRLIIIGDSSTLGHDHFYNSFLDYVETNGNYRSGWEFM